MAAPLIYGCRDIWEKCAPDYHHIKLAALKASPSVVAVVTHDIPHDMVFEPIEGGRYVYSGSGVIIECQEGGDGGTKHVSIIIAAAFLFQRSNGVQPKDIQVDVYQSGGKLYKGELLACDFHYNLAAIKIESDSPSQIATVRCLDDVSFTDRTEQPQLREKQPFQLHPHSSLFKIQHGTRLITLGRACVPPFDLHVHPGVLRPEDTHYTHKYSAEDDCKELLWVAECDFKGDGAPIFNCYGEVIGMMFDNDSFLPSNLVSRWWNYFKTYGEFRRPWLGLEVSDLYEACLGFLGELARRFSNIDKGVVVKKVDEDSSELQPDDVIVKFDEKPVRSRLEFLERIWDNAGKSVKLSFRRASGDQGTGTMIIGEVTPGNFNWWRYPLSRLLETT